MDFVHYCVFCGAHHESDAAVLMAPACPGCGCPLRACAREDFAAIQATLSEQREPRRARMDGAGPIGALVMLPWLLPLAGFDVRDVIFGVPLLFLVFAAVLCHAASRRAGEPRGAWLAYALAAATVTGSIGIGVVLDATAGDSTTGFHLAGIGSLLLAGGLALHLAPRIKWSRPDRVLEAVQLLVLVAAVTVYFVVVPGLRDGDVILTLIVAVDLVAFLLAGLLTAGSRRSQDQSVARRLWAVTTCALMADSVMAADAAGLVAGLPAAHLAAMLYAFAGWFLAGAALSERPAPRPEDLETAERRTLLRRVVLPAAQLAAFPLLAGWAIALHGLGVWPLAWFGATFLAATLAAFGRQAYLVADHRRAVIEERRQRRSAQRRNEELEALTGLATTMTQTLEEDPIVEQALTVLHTAARASSSAFHLAGDDGWRLRATAGHWQADRTWAEALGHAAGVERTVRGARQLTRIELAARGSTIGWVTLVRPEADPLLDRELELLHLLVDQMAIAVQNARDYREKLEQAVRDPLTGLYNRRYFFEALEKEVQRSNRYDTAASLVLMDVDDFKAINDSRGHAVGDDVLRGIARTVSGLLRPSDSFARIGGEEFALLLPETSQMDALLVAERMRAAIAQSRPVEGVRVTVSAGIGACPQDAPTREELVRRTDAALYWAKRNGKDMCAVANEVADGAVDTPAPRPESRVWTAAEAFVERVEAGEPVPAALEELRRELRI